MNVLEAVIGALTDPHDLVVDPFMGSGTILFAALKNNRKTFGSDLSLLSQFLVKASLQVATAGPDLLAEMQRILDRHAEVTLSWFKDENHRFVERIRYQVDGTYEQGDFTLKPVEFVSKEQHDDGRWHRRTAVPAELRPGPFPLHPPTPDVISNPLNFDNCLLPANSRIAIPQGATLSHFFTRENQASINVYLTLIKESPLYSTVPEALKLILSSSLPLLRLSDKKASSQWPYWRPRNNLTSRNPVMVFQKKLDAIYRFQKWAHEAIDENIREHVLLMDRAAQELSLSDTGVRARLVLTDPPYGDQVPYLEYSNLWNMTLELGSNETRYQKEIGLSDAKFRETSTERYEELIRQALRNSFTLLTDDGMVVWFYQDHDLGRWAGLYEEASANGMRIMDVIPIPKQRRSLKTVTSPNATLDGDLLVVFARQDDPGAYGKVATLRRSLPALEYDGGYFCRHAELLRRTVVDGSIRDLSRSHRTVREALKAEKA